MARWTQPLTEDDVTVEPPDDDADEWILRDIVPRSEPWMLAGKWKGGKTWTALSIAIAVALGNNWLGFKNCLGRPGRVLVIALEDNRRRIKRRLWQLLRALDLRPDDACIRANLRITCEPLRMPKDEKALATELTDWNPDLVLIDSVSRVMCGNQNNIDDATKFTEAWGALCKLTKAAVGFLHHTNKGWEGNALPTLDDVRGSGDLVAFPRHVVLMKRRDEENISNVAMFGNLEISRESFVLEYQRTGHDGPVAALLIDRGDYSSYGAAKKQAREHEKSASKASREQQIDQATLAILRDVVPCSAKRLAAELTEKRAGTVSTKQAEASLDRLKQAGHVRSTAKGHVLTDTAGFSSPMVPIPSINGGGRAEYDAGC